MTRTFAYTSNNALRGGPASRWPGDTFANISISSDHSKDVQGSLGGWMRWGDEDYVDHRNAWCGVTVRPSDALRVSMNPNFSHNRNKMQYLETTGFDDTDRYLFGSLDQKTFTLTFRLDYCVTPNLTLQYYGSPFISACRFDTFKRITDPKADAFRDRFHTFTQDEIAFNEANGVYEIDENRDGAVDYEIGNPDFNFLDCNSNVVGRWEYVPGSTLFLVWSQARSDYLSTGTLDLNEDFDTLFDKHPHNVFLVKICKWFSL